MEVFVGTSGWYYEWNKKKNLEWFIENSGLNTVELNASFYRFPFPNQIKSWSEKGTGLRWSVKVHRSVTHGHRFNERALEIWKNFRERFKPLDHLIDFYLFQAAPKYNDVGKILEFAEKADLGERLAFEIRNHDLLGDDAACSELMDRVTMVSVDSPDYRNRIFPGKKVYLRMHGREEWYMYDYPEEELEATAEKIRECGPEKVYVYFNNDHSMLENARMMRDILE